MYIIILNFSLPYMKIEPSNLYTLVKHCAAELLLQPIFL